MDELPSLQYFKKALKSFKKSIPKTEIQPISNKDYGFFCHENPTVIQGMDQSFSMASFSTYPIIKDVKQGEPNCDCVGIIRFANSTIMIISDGCGWGKESYEASRIALKTISSYIIDNIETCKTVKQISQMLIESLHKAHCDILTSLKHQKKGATTILISCYIQTVKPHLLIVSVGDCHCFVFNESSQQCVPMYAKWFRSITETKESGGRIGFYEGTKPDLRNAYMKLIDVEQNDIVIVTTDGFSDNFFNQNTNNINSKNSNNSHQVQQLQHPNDLLNIIVSQKLLESANLNDFVHKISSFLIETTQQLREFHQNPKNKVRNSSLKGKLDHSTIGVFRIENMNMNLDQIDALDYSMLKELYPSHETFKQISSKRRGDLCIKDIGKAIQIRERQMTSNHSTKESSTSRSENCQTPAVYRDPKFICYSPRYLKSMFYDYNGLSPKSLSPSNLPNSPEISHSTSRTTPQSPKTQQNPVFRKFFIKEEDN